MSRAGRLLVAGVSLTALALASGAGAQVSPRPEYRNAVTSARETSWKAINSGQGSGISVAIMERGEFVYSEGLGVAERGQSRAVDRSTRFNIGSVSKMFAAVAIMLLVDEGKVELDVPVVRYIPDFTMKDARHRDITVRMLLNHSSGLPGSTAFFGFEPDASMHRLLLETLKDSRLKHDPGAMSIYCNDGFTLAEIVVRRQAARPGVPRAARLGLRQANRRQRARSPRAGQGRQQRVLLGRPAGAALRADRPRADHLGTGERRPAGRADPHDRAAGPGADRGRTRAGAADRVACDPGAHHALHRELRHGGQRVEGLDRPIAPDGDDGAARRREVPLRGGASRR